MNVPQWLIQPYSGWLTDAEKQGLAAIVLRLHPGDASRNVPSALDAGVVNFVSLLLARTAQTYIEIPIWQKRYRDGLADLEAWAQATLQKSLAAMDDAEMNQLIGDLEKGAVVGLPATYSAEVQKTLFTTFLRHTIQGCYADPRWGGNNNKVMWRFLGVAQQPETTAQISNDPLPTIPL